MIQSVHTRMFMSSSYRSPITLNASESRVIEGRSTDYNTAITATTGYFAYDSPTIGTHNIKQDVNYRVFRSFIKFDFSAIIGTVTEAKIYMTDNSDATKIYIYKCENSGTVTEDDYDNFTTSYGVGATTDYILDGLNRHVYFITLNASALTEINNKGVLRFVTRSDNDVNAITPGTGFASYYNIMPYVILTF